MIYNDKKQYDGFFINSKPEGHGTETIEKDENQVEYEGDFHEGMKNGNFKVSIDSEVVKYESYKNDILITVKGVCHIEI